MNSMIPLMGRGMQINDPLETAGNAASLQNLLQLNQMRQRSMDAEDAQRAAMQQRIALGKRAYQEAADVYNKQNSAARTAAATAAANAPQEMPPGSPMPGSGNSPLVQGEASPYVPAEGADAAVKPIPVVGNNMMSDPKFHEIFALTAKDYGLDDVAELAMKHRSDLLKEQAPQSEIGKMLKDTGNGVQGAMGKIAVWNKVKGNPPDGFAWDPETGDPKPIKEVQDFLLNLKKSGAPKMQMFNNTKDDFKNERDLRNDFKSEPIYKAHTEVQSAYQQIKSGIKQKSPAGDMAAATKFMKILDPTSVVRESELNIALAASGILDRAMNFLPKIINGYKLTPDQREDFGKLADEFYRLSKQSYDAKSKEYKGIASDYGLNADRVGGSGGWSIEEVK